MSTRAKSGLGSCRGWQPPLGVGKATAPACCEIRGRADGAASRSPTASFALATIRAVASRMCSRARPRCTHLEARQAIVEPALLGRAAERREVEALASHARQERVVLDLGAP